MSELACELRFSRILQTTPSMGESMRLNRLRQSVVAILVLVAFMCQGTWVLAQTTGSLSGTVVETGTTTPISGAKVTADSPSQTSSATTDSNGKFSFISLPPDTYTVSI